MAAQGGAGGRHLPVDVDAEARAMMDIRITEVLRDAPAGDGDVLIPDFMKVVWSPDLMFTRGEIRSAVNAAGMEQQGLQQFNNIGVVLLLNYSAAYQDVTNATGASVMLRDGITSDMVLGGEDSKRMIINGDDAQVVELQPYWVQRPPPVYDPRTLYVVWDRDHRFTREYIEDLVNYSARDEGVVMDEFGADGVCESVNYMDNRSAIVRLRPGVDREMVLGTTEIQNVGQKDMTNADDVQITLLFPAMYIMYYHLNNHRIDVRPW